MVRITEIKTQVRKLRSEYWSLTGRAPEATEEWIIDFANYVDCNLNTCFSFGLKYDLDQVLKHLDNALWGCDSDWYESFDREVGHVAAMLLGIKTRYLTEDIKKEVSCRDFPCKCRSGYGCRCGCCSIPWRMRKYKIGQTYDDDEVLYEVPWSNKIGITFLGKERRKPKDYWKKDRLVWIAFYKQKDTTLFGKLPKEIIQNILRYTRKKKKSNVVKVK